MAYVNFTTALDADGILLVTWNMPDRSMNVFTEEVTIELDKIVDAAIADAAVKGVVVTSGKTSFSGGADIKLIERLLTETKKIAARDKEAAAKFCFEESRKLSLLFRKIETCGKPWVSAINGLCLGGAFELSLACHARVMSDDDKAQVGLPEVKVGIFPGAGGTQRVMRLTDPQSGLMMLLQGTQHRAAKAKALNLVTEVAPAGTEVEVAKRLLREGKVDKVAPWDKKEYKLPGGKIYSPAGMQFWPAANAIYRRETHDNYPGARAILQSCYEGLQMPIDIGLRIESRLFAAVLQTKEAGGMLRTLFGSLQELNKGARRPEGVKASKLKTVAVVGAGFMGAGIAHVTAMAGIDVVLLDRDVPSAEKGKAYSAGLLADRVKKGRMTQAAADAVLARIRTTADYADLDKADLVIEAVFENRDIKRDVTEKAEAVIRRSAIFASNTSTLPITSLAKASKRPKNFVGIHFFSPVDKMMLVEIILGKKTSDKALAVALDYVKAIKKTPIVVNDTRGFYVNRCVTNYIREAHLMLTEGVPAIMVDRAGLLAGMPVGPLTLNDEVAIDLGWKILQQTKADLGDKSVDPRQENLLKEMVVVRERLGKKVKKGFYDYPEGKGKKTIWKGIEEIVGPAKPAEAFDIEELKDRFKAIIALEAAKCVEEGVVTDLREADVGAILGFGFSPFTGGPISYIDGMGSAGFVALLDKLARKHGARFRPTKGLKAMAAGGATFYGGGAGAPAAPAKLAA